MYYSKKYVSEKYQYTSLRKKLFTEDFVVSNEISGPLSVGIISSFYFLLKVFYNFQMFYHK